MNETLSAIITLAIPVLFAWWAVRHFRALSGKIPSNPPVYYIKGAKHYHASAACPQARNNHMRKTTCRMARFKGMRPCGHCYTAIK